MGSAFRLHVVDVLISAGTIFLEVGQAAYESGDSSEGAVARDKAKAYLDLALNYAADVDGDEKKPVQLKMDALIRGIDTLGSPKFRSARKRNKPSFA